MAKIVVEALDYLDKTVEQVVDADIAEFDVAFQGLGNDPLVRSERAILKTYLAYKLGLMKNVPAGGPPKEPTPST